VEIGLPVIAFTEHLDHSVWTVAPGDFHVEDPLAALVTPDGRFTPPHFDASGYLDAIEQCRERFPGLRILSGVEVGEPHWHAGTVAAVLARGRFDRVLGSLHCLPYAGGLAEPWNLYRYRPAAEVVREYLAEIARLVVGSGVFSVLAHVDYPLRYWPDLHAGPFDVSAFEAEFRHALRATADSGRVLEINTRVPLHASVLGWWRDEGGEAVSFGSDAHEPSDVAQGFRDAADMAEVYGFRPGPNPYDFWR
jgi:histidinol-phosphatase (PHP family)